MTRKLERSRLYELPPGTSVRYSYPPLTTAGGKASIHPHTIWGKCR